MPESALDQLPEEYRYSGRTGQLLTEDEAAETLRRIRAGEEAA